MAFNGTKNLPGKKMIEYLERNGVKFGADLNAYTSYDETCYNLDNVPTAKPCDDRHRTADPCTTGRSSSVWSLRRSTTNAA